MDLSRIGIHEFDNFKIEIVDSVEEYTNLMKELFDFQRLRKFFSENPSFKILFDGMHGGRSGIVDIR
jgi:phosphoglucomutase